MIRGWVWGNGNWEVINRPLSAVGCPLIKDGMTFKFEKLEVWQLSLEYSDRIYHLATSLPTREQYNLKPQMIRAVTSISLNIAEGSTSQSDAEFARFIGMAIRSLVEVIACLHLARRRKYVDSKTFNDVYTFGEKLFAKLQALRKRLKQ